MDLQKKMDELGVAFEAFKKANDDKLTAIEKKGYAPADLEEKVNKANADIDKISSAVEEMKTALNRTGGLGGDTPEQKQKQAMSEYKNAFKTFLAKGKMPSEGEKAAMMKACGMEGKAFSVDSDEDGGFFVDPETSGEIVKKLYESSPVRQLSDVITISSDSYEFIADDDEAGSGWVGETATRSETTTPTIGKGVIPVHELYAEPQASQKFLDDAAVNVEAWLSGHVADKFARDEATAFISGNGMAKPKGILAYASTSVAWNTVELKRTVSATALADGDDFINVQALLKEPYQMNASWLINRLIIGEIRKIKDATSGQYIWQPGLTVQTPNVLLGRPVYMASDLDSTLAIDNYLAIYGDFKQGYKIVDRVGIRVLRDPYTSKPNVKFYTTKRVGGGIKQGEALKILQCKAS